jgi:hypothetical protein
MHGAGAASRIHQVTLGAFVVKPGSLFPPLRRLEQSKNQPSRASGIGVSQPLSDGIVD